MPSAWMAIACRSKHGSGFVDKAEGWMARKPKKGIRFPFRVNLLDPLEGAERAMFQERREHGTGAAHDYQSSSGTMGSGGRQEPMEFSFGGSLLPTEIFNVTYSPRRPRLVFCT